MPDSEPVSVLLASQIITMDSGRPNGRAVAVRGSRIVTVGSLKEVTSALGDEPFSIDRTHEHDVILPGLIDQHLHPFLGATTLTTEVRWQHISNGNTKMPNNGINAMQFMLGVYRFF